MSHVGYHHIGNISNNNIIRGSNNMLKALGTDRYSVEELQAWMDENSLEIKRKHIHRTHQMNRYLISELNVKGRVTHEGKVYSYVNYDHGVCGYEVVTSIGEEQGYFWTVWTTHCHPITSNSKESE